MSRIGLGRHVSLLDEDSVDTPVDNGEVAVEEEVSAPIADATEETAEVEAEDIGAEQAMDSHETLEEVEDAVIAAEADGGLDRQSAVFAHLAMKAAMGKADYDYFVRSSKIPSVESYNGGSSSRQRYTAITREGLGTALRGFWEAIVRQIKKMWAAVKNWYLKVLDAAPRMKARAEALAKKSSDVTGSASEKSFDMGGLNQLHIGGKSPSGSDAVKTMKLLSKGASESLGSKTSGCYDKTFDNYERLLDKVKDLGNKDVKGKKIDSLSSFYEESDKKGAKEKSEELAKGFETGFDISKSNVDGSAEKRFGKDVKVKVSDELFGGRQVAVFTSKIDDDAFTIVRLARASGPRFIEAKEKPRDIDSTGNFKTLATSEIRQLMDELSDICEHIITYKKSWEQRDKQFNKMDNAAKKAVAEADKDKDAHPIKTRLVKDVAIGMSAVYQIGIRFENQLIQYLLAVGRATIAWVERSLSQYKNA